MAKKVILKDNENVEILPITRGELVLDSSGKEALHSNKFLATQSLPGLMSNNDKKKLDGLFNTEVDNALDFNSENPVQNKVVSTAIKNITDSYLKSADVNGNTLTITDQDDETIDFYNTTYSFADGTNGSFTVTPLGGTTQTVKVGGILTDDKVKLTPSSDNKDYRVLFSYTDDDNTKTEGSRKSSKLKFNPSSGALTATTLLGNLDGTYVNKLTNYKKASEVSDLAVTDSLNTALGKLEYKADTAFTFCNSIMGPDTDDVINKYDEIVNFIDSVKETETDILDTFVTRKTTLTIDGTKTFSKIIKSTVTNSAPFSVASSTVVTNLNSDLLDGFEASTLFQSLSNVNTETNPNSISIKIGNTTKYLKVGYADKVGSNFTLKVNSGTTEGIDKYTYNGSTAKTLNIKPGSNVSFSTSSGELTINSSYVNTTYSLSGALSNTNDSYTVTLTPSSGSATTATISKMVGATTSIAGKAGLVPKPGTGDVNSFLKGDGSWGTPVNTWRPVSVNGTSMATSTTGTGTLNLKSGTGISVSGTAVNDITITNAGVRSVTLGTGDNVNKLAVNTNGDTKYLTIPYAANADKLDNLNSTDFLRNVVLNGTFSSVANIPTNLTAGIHRLHIASVEYSSILTGYDWYGSYWLLYFHPSSGYTLDIRYRATNCSTWKTLLDSNNSSVTGAGGSTWGSSITVKINGTAKTLTIPSNPNTHWTTRIYAGASGTATNTQTTNPYLKITDDNTYRNLVRLVGSGATTVTSDTSGNVTISSTNTTYSFSNNNPTLAWGTKSTIGTVGGVLLTVTMPANPNTDTHWTTRLYAGASGTNTNALVTNPYLKVTDNNTYRNQVRFVGAGATTVTSDANGNITISSTDTNTNTTYSTATSSTLGLVKIGYTQSGKNYPVLLSNGLMYVNVPWSDTNTTYSQATSSTLGLVKIGYTLSGKNYPVQLSSGQMYVNVPWTDTNTTYSKATSSTLGLVKIGYTTTGKNYAVLLNSAGLMYVNVPWSNTSTTYSLATSSTLGLVKIGYSTSGKNYAVQLNSSGQMYVNVPWTDTNTNTWRSITNTYTGSSQDISVSLYGTNKMYNALINGSTSTHPVVLLAGTLYRNSAGSTATWYFTGMRHRAVSSTNPTIYVSGGVARFYFTSNSGYGFSIYAVSVNHQASGEATSYTGTEYKTRSSGLFWFGSYSSGLYIYIRAISLGDLNNDTAISYAGLWNSYKDGVTRIQIVAVGYAW